MVYMVGSPSLFSQVLLLWYSCRLAPNCRFVNAALSETRLFRSDSSELFALFDVVASQHSKLNQFEDKGYGFNKKRKYHSSFKSGIF